MAHSQKSIRDHARNRSHPNVDNQAIAQQLEDLVKPCVYHQLAYYRSLGMRERILSLPLMTAAVLTLLWRQVPSARELNRMLARENRSLPVSVAHAHRHFERVWIVDASTLEALFRKLKSRSPSRNSIPGLRRATAFRSLEAAPVGQLGGRICAIINLKTRYPVQTWFEERPYAHESNFVPQLLAFVPANTLLLLDRGFWNFCLFEQLIGSHSQFITRLKAKAHYQSLQVLSQSRSHRDQLIRLGTGYQGNPILQLRLVEIRLGSTWYRYLTSVLDPQVFPPYVVADLYSRRWRIEETFYLLKRLLGLSYLWTGSVNGIKLQLWATWLFYGILIDLADAVADELALPFESISVEMVFRSLYHFTQALNQGMATHLVAYLVAPENRDLGVVKAPRSKRLKPPLDLSPFPSS